MAQPHSRTFVLSIPPGRPLVSHSRGVGPAPTGSQEPWGPMPPSSELRERKLAMARTRTLWQAPRIRASGLFSGELVVKIHQHALAHSAGRACFPSPETCLLLPSSPAASFSFSSLLFTQSLSHPSPSSSVTSLNSALAIIPCNVYNLYKCFYINVYK